MFIYYFGLFVNAKKAQEGYIEDLKEEEVQKLLSKSSGYSQKS
ncbi:DUF1816 domain-containing protein [Fischerella sp. PCC 9605]